MEINNGVTAAIDAGQGSDITQRLELISYDQQEFVGQIRRGKICGVDDRDEIPKPGADIDVRVESREQL